MNDDERRWLEECFRGVREDIAGVNRRLDVLNGSVRKHETTLAEHSQSLRLVYWLAGAVAVSLIGLAFDWLPRILAQVR